MTASLKRLCSRAAPRNFRCIHTISPQSSRPEVQQLRQRSPLANKASPEAAQLQHRHAYATKAASMRMSRRRNGDQDDDPAPVARLARDMHPHEGVDMAEISSTGHEELAQHREIREMVRTAAWEMPLLTQLALPFEPPNTKKLPLRWRYTTYLGDSHPASRKVVVEFNTDDLPELNSQQVLKLKKLVGVRLNPQTSVVRMSCESFGTQAQNKRYLGDTIAKLLAEVRDASADSLEDIPLDTRHHKFKKRSEFPEEWKLTSQRSTQLAQRREALLLEEGKRVEDGTIVSGIAAIEAARQLKLRLAEEQPVLVEAKKPSR